MGVRLSIEIASPLDPEDRDLLAGIAVMTLAIANREMAKARFPEMFADEEDEVDGPDTSAARSSHSPSESVPPGTAGARQGGTTPGDDELDDRGGKGEVWPPDPRPDIERSSR